MEYDKAVDLLGQKSSKLRKIKSDYVKLQSVLSTYSFNKD